MNEENESGDAARPQRSFWSWVGTAVVASLGAGLGCAAWFVAFGLVMSLVPEHTAEEVSSPGSLKPGLTLGLAVAGLQAVHAWTRKESQLLTTLAMTLVAGALGLVSPWISTSLSHQVDVAAFVFLMFSLAHVAAFSFIHIWRWLAALRLPGVAPLLSAMALAPMCGGVVVADEVALLSEPADSVDGGDVVAGLFTVSRELCFLQVADWRGEAVRVAQGSGLRREDAEDVVGSVILSVCTTEGLRADLRPYFFASVRKRTADPWRRAARRQQLGDAWGAEPWQPAPTPEAIVAETNGCLGLTMRTLPDDQRSLVVLTVIQGRTLDEAATLLGRSRSALDRTKHKALESLRKACFNK